MTGENLKMNADRPGQPGDGLQIWHRMTRLEFDRPYGGQRGLACGVSWSLVGNEESLGVSWCLVGSEESGLLCHRPMRHFLIHCPMPVG